MANGRTRSELEITLAPGVDVALATFKKEAETRFDHATVNKVMQLAIMRGASSLVPFLRAEMPTQRYHKYGFRRMQGAIKARKSRFYTPGAAVGISVGRSRRDKKGAWYAWMYTSGTKPHVEVARVKNSPMKIGPKLATVVHHKGFHGRPFVEKVSMQHLPQVTETITKISTKFLVDEAFQQRIFKSVNRSAKR